MLPSSLSLPATSSAATSFAEALLQNVRQTPDEAALIFLPADQPELCVTFAQVWADAQGQAARLAAMGIASGDRLLLLGHHDYQLVQVWLGAMLLGAIPAILPYLPAAEPGAPASDEAALERAARFAGKSNARAVVMPKAWLDTMGEALPAAGVDRSRCAVVALDEPGVAASSQAALTYHPVGPDTTAYIQLTSGTTGEAKGTLITHGALLEHVDQLVKWLELGRGTAFAGWLPLSHDMGLGSQVLLPLLSGGHPSVMLTPTQWLRRPSMLLRAVHTYRVAMMGMPAFGIAYCSEHIRDEELEGVDLSCVRACLVGAELISAATIARFVKRFAAWGLRPTAMVPGYGLAEAVSAVTLSPLGRGMHVDWVEREAFQREGVARPVHFEANGGTEDGPVGTIADEPAPDVLAWVSCGKPLPDTRIEIVNGDGAPQPERHTGQVVLYREGLQAATVGATTAPPPDHSSGVVHTGDIGYLAAGELYLCGRQDELIIVGGGKSLSTGDRDDCSCRRRGESGAGCGLWRA